MGNRKKLRKKLKGFIHVDRPLKLKSYVAFHKIWLPDVFLGLRRNALHYCAQHGTADMMRCLIKLKCDPSQQDRYGNLPLHLALQRGLHEEIKQARETLLELVPVLLDAYPLGQDVENKEGATGHDLLTSLRKKIKSASTAQKHVAEAIEKQKFEELWKQKLYQEAMYDYEEGMPRCSDDIQQEESEPLDGDWFEEIRQARAEKQRRKQNTFFYGRKRKHENSTNEQSSSKKPHQQQQETEDDKLKKDREEMKKRFKPTTNDNSLHRLLFKKQRYESKFIHLLDHLPGQTLTFACIPWPSADLNSVLNVLFCDLADRQSTSFQKYLRAQQIRWHPDKFTQKFGDHLHPDHVSKVMGRVKAISQILNQLRTSIASK